MRPIRLDVKGFTAFRDPAAIEFAELDVFAIAGQTGSGKSSLLDAMTYALFGRVERVGDRVSQLVSQGQPRMAVKLEFEVGRDRYRVTRTTPAKGATKIQLERWVGDDWQQAGPGAGRVRGADAMIIDAIGLDYDAFTRSVLLPQGKFAELLVGDARKRRDILTELLGLALFRRMAERAGTIGKESGVRAQERSAMVEREYPDATPDAAKDAARAAVAAEKRERALARAAVQVQELLGRWEAAQRSVEALRASLREVTAAAAAAAEAGRALTALAEGSRDADAGVSAAAAEAASADAALEEARTAVRAREAEGRSAADLARTQALAGAMAEAARALAARTAERAAMEEAAGRLAAATGTAEQVLAERTEALAAAEAAALAAEAALDEATHADMVGAVSAGLKAGDPCPVCGVPLARAPRVAGSGALDRARKAAAAARAGLDGAKGAAAAAERTLADARRDAAATEAEGGRLDREIAALGAAMAERRASVAAILGDPLPDDPIAALESSLAEIQGLDRAESDAARLAAEAARNLSDREKARDRLRAETDRIGDRLLADPGPLLERTARALDMEQLSVALPSTPDEGDPFSLAAFADALAISWSDLAAALAATVDDRTSAEAGLLADAREAVGDLVDPAPTLEALAVSVLGAVRSATADVATTAQRAEHLAARVEHRRQLEQEARELGERAQLFRALAQELRADRLIAFLQAEALELLAIAGSERLAALSDGRYRIIGRDDEFFVVDTWNGEEERSVRTLSGGETFLASLSLALALADQVRSLSVTDRARLDSLFLDEGFGTLDPETLRTVTDAIEQLGGDGRMVGIITHVRELAEQFPRIEVTKSPRGSRLELVT